MVHVPAGSNGKTILTDSAPALVAGFLQCVDARRAADFNERGGICGRAHVAHHGDDGPATLSREVMSAAFVDNVWPFGFAHRTWRSGRLRRRPRRTPPPCPPLRSSRHS